jgi:hypothetical protein
MDLITMRQKMVHSISSSVTLILSNNMSKLNPFFTVSELILVLLAVFTILSVVKTLPGFNASWRVIKELVLFVTVRLFIKYIDENIVLNLIFLLILLESIPQSLLSKLDLESFPTSITYIFSDKMSALLNRMHIPLFALSLCLGGKGLLGRTFAFVGINTLCEVVFEVIGGFIWSVTILYFVYQMKPKNDIFFNFGLYQASDSVYKNLLLNMTPSTIFMAFLFLGMLFPKDPVWSGVCVLVFVRGGSDWFIGQLGNSDPFLAGLSLVTFIHFLSAALDNKV